MEQKKQKQQKRKVEFTLPWPPSINNYYGRRKDGGKYLKATARNYLESMPWEIKRQCGQVKLKGKVKVNYVFATPSQGKHDISNLYKALDDVMERSGIIENDNDIYRGNSEKYDRGTVTITVEEI